MKRFTREGRQREIYLSFQQDEIITIEELQRIYDEPSSKSRDNLIDVLHQLKNIDPSVLTDPLIINHEFYSLIINKLQDLLTLWNEKEHLIESDSNLFHYIIRILSKMKFSPDQLVESIEKCLKDISNNGKLLNNNNHFNDFLNLLDLYTQNEQIIELIIKCLCSKYYIEMFQSIDNQNFLLLTFPTYWINYKGQHREELADTLLNSLLISSIDLLKKKPIQQWHQPLTQLIDLLTHSLELCNMTIFKNDIWIEISNILLILLTEELLLKERKLMIKSICYLLLILINNDQNIYQFIKLFQQRFEILIETENESCLLLTSIIDDEQIETLINKNKDFAQFLQEFLKENKENIRLDAFIQRLKKFSAVEDENIFERVIPTTVTIQKSNENKNEEDITLIWFDKNINSNEKTIEFLKQINDNVLTCSDRETFLQYIQQIKTEKIFLILSGLSAEEILEEIHHEKQIDSIFIFCFKSDKYEKYLNNEQFHKVIGIYTEYQTLFNSIQENIRYSIRQSEAAGLFDQDEKSMRNLNRESYFFNHFLAFKQILLKTTYNDERAKHEMIEISRNYYRNNKKELLNIDQFEETYQSKDAIYWYTKQSFIYRLVNKALRTEDYQGILVLRFFILDLCENIREKYEELKLNSQTIVSYRGLKLSQAEIYNLKHNIDATIATNGFLSTSRSKDIALKFAKKGTKRSNLETVMLQINVDLSKVTTSLADIAQFSDYPEEEEILFDLGASFTINSVDYDTTQNIWFVKLEAQSQESTINDIQNVLKEYRSENDMNILLGKLIYKTENYHLCHKYFQNILNFYPNEDYESLAKIYDYIGTSFNQLKDYDKSIINYTKSLEYYTLLNRMEDVARLTTLIGLSYFCKEDKDTAQVYYKRSHEMWKQLPTYASENPHCEIGRLMFCFNLLEENNEISLDYTLKALKIYENPSSTCEHIDHDYWIGFISETLADKYYDNNDYNKAFEYIMKSIPMRRKNLSTKQMRKDYFFCLSTLCRICGQIHEDIWKQYRNEYYPLIDIDLVHELPYLKDSFDTINNVRRFDFSAENIDQNLLNEFLEHSFKSLKYFLKNDPTNYERIIQAHIDIGFAYTKAKHYHWASENLETALQISQTHLPTNSKHISTIYTHLSDLSLDRKNFDQAFILRMKSLSINPETSQLTEKQREAQCYFDIAFKLPDTNPDEPFQFFMKSLEIWQEILPDDNTNLGRCHANIGDIYKQKSMYDLALEHYKKAIQIYENNLSDSTVKLLHKTVYSIITTIYCLQGKYDQAFNFRMKGLNYDDKYSNLTEQEKEAQCYSDIGLKLIEHDTDKALEYSQKSIEIRQGILPKDHVTVGFSHQDIGAAYEKKSELNMALEHYQKAIEIYEKHLFDKEEYQFNIKTINIHCLSNLVRIYCIQEKYDQVFDIKMKILNIDEKYSYLNEKEKEAQCYFDIGEKLFQQDIDKALEYSQKSLQIRQDILPGDHVTIGCCYHSIAWIYESKSMIDMAIENYTKAIKIYKKHLFDKDKYEFDIKTVYVHCHSHLAQLCQKQGKYDHAFDFRMKALNIDAKYSNLTEKEKEAQCYFDVAENLFERDIDKALEYSQKSLQIRQDILPKDHVTIGFTHRDIGAAYEKKSMFDMALEHYEKAIEIYEKYLFHKEEYQFNVKELYIQCQLRLCRICCYNGKFDDGYTWKIKALQIDEKYSLATEQEKETQCYFDNGTDLFIRDANKALQFCEKLLQIAKEFLRGDAFTLGFNHQDIGAIYEKMSMFDIALEHYQKAIEIYEKHLFHQQCHLHVKTPNIHCLSNLVRIYCIQEKYDQAFDIKMKVLNIDEKYSRLNEQQKQAQCYFDIGNQVTIKQVHKRLEFLFRSLEIRQQIESHDHITLGFCYQYIGSAYEDKYKFDISIEYYTKAIEIYEKHLLDKEEYQFNVVEMYGKCCSSMSNCYSVLEKIEYVNAINYALKAVQIYQEYSPKSKNNLADSYRNHGYILMKKGQYDEAIVHIQKSLDTLLYENNILVGFSYHIFSVCFYGKSEYEQALTFGKKALKNYEQFVNNLNDSNIGHVSYVLALSLFKLNKFDEALEYAIRSIQIREDILPSIDVQRAESHSLLALIYSKLSQNDQCNEHCINALEISKRIISNGETHEELSGVFENIGELYKIQNNLPMAQKYYQKTLEYIIKEKINDHPDIQRIQNIIDELLNNEIITYF